MVFEQRVKQGIRALVVVSSLVLIAGAWLGGTGIIYRFVGEGIHSDRPTIWANSLAVNEDFRLFGSGAGTFRWVFPAYKEQILGGSVYEHAHNDYLEHLVERGVVGATLLYWALASAVLILLAGLRQRRDPYLKGVLYGCLLGVVSFLAHGLVDFNFQIPANAAYLFVLLALGTAAACVDKPNSNINPRFKSA